MKVRFIIRGENPQPLWIADLENIPFKEGETLDISAFRYIKWENDIKKEKLEYFNGMFKVVEIVHKLTFEFILSQNTTYNECIIYLNKEV